MEQKCSWGRDLALRWTRMVGPSRPTISELAVYTKYLRILQSHLDRKVKILVLGSTPEFRDWAFEENLDVTVMDYSQEYHETISRELRHKSIVENKQGKEQFICDDWINLNSIDEYDIIIGDLVIGNVPPQSLESFIEKVSKALKKEGLFLGKSFFVPRNYTKITPKELIKKYYNGPPYHPYSFLSFDLTMYSIDDDNMLSFEKQYNELKKLNEQGFLFNDTMAYFEDIGWDKEMKFKFHVPKVEEYEKLINKYLNIFDIEYGNDVYSHNFPLYIITKKDTIIFRR